MSTLSNKDMNLTSKNAGIGDLLTTIRNKMKMSKAQRRFSLAAVVVILLALLLVIVLTGRTASNTVILNERAEALQDATGGEVVIANEDNTIQFAEGTAYK